eukprot:9760889-Lingulodinium_polyedra.AAC.1
MDTQESLGVAEALVVAVGTPVPGGQQAPPLASQVAPPPTQPVIEKEIEEFLLRIGPVCPCGLR